MSLEVNIHAAQTSILRELLFHPHAGYAKLQKPTGLTSDHFNFHISRLVELGLVEKVSRGLYGLTPRGADFIWLHTPGGYVGISGAHELGYATALGKKIFCKELPKDEMLATQVIEIKSVFEVLESLGRQ